jgi:hypothetical protein
VIDAETSRGPCVIGFVNEEGTGFGLSYFVDASTAEVFGGPLFFLVCFFSASMTCNECCGGLLAGGGRVC